MNEARGGEESVRRQQRSRTEIREVAAEKMRTGEWRVKRGEMGESREPRSGEGGEPSEERGARSEGKWGDEMRDETRRDETRREIRGTRHETRTAKVVEEISVAREGAVRGKRRVGADVVRVVVNRCLGARHSWHAGSIHSERVGLLALSVSHLLGARGQRS
jgi:hypothetical protein